MFTGVSEAAAARADEAIDPEATSEGTVAVDAGAEFGLYVAKLAVAVTEAGREVEAVDEASTTVVEDERGRALVEAPTSMVPVTVARPSSEHNSTKELWANVSGHGHFAASTARTGD